MGRMWYGVFAVLLAAGIFGVQEIVVLRRQVHAQESTVRQLQEENEKACRAILEGQNRLNESIRQQFDAYRLVSLSRVDESNQHLLDASDRLAGLIRRETGNLAEVVTREITSQEHSVATALEQAAANEARLTEVRQQIDKDCGRLKESMVYPTVQLRGNGTVGSGVIIYSGSVQRSDGTKSPATYVLTAYHVILEVTKEDRRDIVENVRIMGQDGQLGTERHRAAVLTFDRKRDIALLKLEVDGPLRYVARFIAPEDLAGIEIFEPAYAVGCPLGNMPLPSAGEITTKKKIVDGQVFWMLDAPTYFGNSGGGIFRARDGRLIGVSSMIYTYGRTNPVVVPHLGLFVPAETIFTWLDSMGFGFVYDPAKKVPGSVVSRGDGGSAERGGVPEPTLEHAGYRPTAETP